MKSLGTHIELVRELGLDRRIRREDDASLQRALVDVVVGTVVGCGLIGMLYVGALALDRMAR